MTELVLGTAQFGAGYGVTNGARRLADDEVEGIVSRAVEAGISTFDTAPDYDDAQDRLGAIPGERRYISKFRLSDDLPSATGLYSDSLARLGVTRLRGLLAHRMADLRDERWPAALELLREAREGNRVQRVGVSIYDQDDLELALLRFPDLDILQLPGSILDRRLIQHSSIERLRGHGVEIHVRSAFLQGLILASPNSLPAHFAELRPALEELSEAAGNSSVLELALGYLRDCGHVDAVVVGAASAPELEQIVAAWSSRVTAPALSMRVPEHVLDPRRWPRA